MIAFYIIAGIVVILLLSSFFTVKQQTAYVIERFGKFHSVRNSGLQLRIPLIDKIAGVLSLRIIELDVMVETKTKDNVFVELKVSVQYQVIQDSIYQAFYKLTNPRNQITSYIFDTIRAEVPKMILDDVFENKDEVASAIKKDLDISMSEYGFMIIKALVTDINPNENVKKSMNQINAAARLKKAAEFEAEAEKIKIVAKATAEAESKKLQGMGIANQRKQIAQGLEDSVNILNRVGIGSAEASSLIIVTQHYDTLQSIGNASNSNLILLPNNPTAASSMLSEMTASMIATQNYAKNKS